MKLSKVKKICLDRGIVLAKQANAGIDVSTWIGINSAMYPIHGMELTAGMVVKIWEIKQNQLAEMLVMDDGPDKTGEVGSLIRKLDMEDLPMMADGGNKIRWVCKIDGWVLLMDSNNRGFVFDSDLMDPVEGKEIEYINLDGGDKTPLIGVYADKVLEAVIRCVSWYRSDTVKQAFQDIAYMFQVDNE